MTCPMRAAHLGRDGGHHPHALRKALRVSGGTTIAGRAEWLDDATCSACSPRCRQDGEEARIAGGAVRNALLGEPVADIDIATTTPARRDDARAREAAGFKAVPTGIEHGTVTVVADGTPYEVTTLRADIETDGRRAVVAFGRDWKADAERRDFTINALYAEADGTVVDLVGGLADLESRTLRFIGDAETRIREDYLRILRFFRFFAWYGDGRPDADGAEGLRAAEGRARPAFGRARLGGAEEAARRARSVAGAVVDAPGGRADARAAREREMGHRRHPRAGGGGEVARLGGGSVAQAGRNRAAGRGAHGGAGGAAEDVEGGSLAPGAVGTRQGGRARAATIAGRRLRWPNASMAATSRHSRPAEARARRGARAGGERHRCRAG